MSITRINTNTDSLLATANLNKVQFDMSRTLSHLSSGLRIVTGSDDPAGTGLSATFKAQLGGIVQAVQNAQDGLSMMALADSAIGSNMDALLRMRDIAVRAASDATLTANQKVTMETEFQKLRTEIGTRTGTVTFNGKYLFAGSTNGKIIQIGPNNTTGTKLSILIQSMNVNKLGTVSISATAVSGGRASAAITKIQSAIESLSNVQTVIGAQEKMLERMVNDLNSQQVNVAAASSRITDADLATEISNFAKQQVIAQAAAAMVAQANAMPGAVMKTLGIG